MSTENTEPRRSPEQEFARRVSQTAMKQLSSSLNSEAGKKAAQSISMAFLSAMRAARDPSAFLSVSAASVASCVSLSLETELYPGGPNPTVYLVPQAAREGETPDLQWRITHRGLAILASRAGFMLVPVPVGAEDKLTVAYGEACSHESDPATWPEKLEDMQGVIVVIRRLSDGVIIARPWVPRALIEKRQRKAQTQSVWRQWPVEMAQKTAIKWAFSRGLVPLDTPELRAAITADNQADVIDAEEPAPTDTSASRPSAREALGLPAAGAASGTHDDSRALPDHGGESTPDFRAEAERLAERERVEPEQRSEPEPKAQARKPTNRKAPPPQDEPPPGFFGDDDTGMP